MVDWAKILENARAVVEGARAPETARFLMAWPTPRDTRPIVPATLEVLQWLGAAARDAPAGTLGTLARRLADAAPSLGWRRTYRAGDVPDSFLERYGWCELLGSTGPVPCDALAGGLLLVGPDTHYPAHSHAAEELYVPLSGAAEWQRGDAPFAVRQPGDAIFHASHEPHAMRSGAAPLLALYLWRGDGLGEATRLRPPARHGRV
jgi:hypothetical protein